MVNMAAMMGQTGGKLIVNSVGDTNTPKNWKYRIQNTNSHLRTIIQKISLVTHPVQK